MYLALAGACAEQKANSASGYSLADIDGGTVEGINYSFTQDTANNINIITGITVTSSNFFVSNTGGGGTYDSGTEQVRKLDLANTDGIWDQTDDVSAITGSNQQFRGLHADDTGTYFLFPCWVNNDLKAASYATGEDITSSLSSLGTISNPLGSVGLQGACWSNDGNYLAVATGTSASNNGLRSYALSSAYSLSSPTAHTTKTLTGDATTNGAITDIKYNDDGTKIFVSSSKIIREFALSTAYDVSSMAGTPTYTLDLSSYLLDRDAGPIYSTSGVAEGISGFDWNEDGTVLYVASTFGGTSVSGSPSPSSIYYGKSGSTTGISANTTAFDPTITEGVPGAFASLQSGDLISGTNIAPGTKVVMANMPPGTAMLDQPAIASGADTLTAVHADTNTFPIIKLSA